MNSGGKVYHYQAIRTIEKAVNEGYRDVMYLSTEVDLDPLRSEEAFGLVLETIRRTAGKPPVPQGK